MSVLICGVGGVGVGVCVAVCVEGSAATVRQYVDQVLMVYHLCVHVHTAGHKLPLVIL